MNIKRFLLAVAFSLASVGAAQAAQSWAWSYSGTGITASGTFTTAGPATSFEDVLSISGTRNGVAITGLVPLDTDPLYAYDNQFTAATPHFTDSGLLFDFSGAFANVNLYYFAGTYTDLYEDVNGDLVETPVIFNVTAVPEPATVLMLLAGLGVLGVYARKSRSAV